MQETVDAYIISGGRSVRFKRDKSLYEFNGKPLIGHVYDAIKPLFKNISIIADDTVKYRFLGIDTYPDIIPGLGPIGGLYTALSISRTRSIFTFACDTPFIRGDFIQYMIEASAGHDVAIPGMNGRYEPLHAVYSQKCAPHIKFLIDSGGRKIINFFDRIDLLKIPDDVISRYDPDGKMFFNINYFEDIDGI